MNEVNIIVNKKWKGIVMRNYYKTKPKRNRNSNRIKAFDCTFLGCGQKIVLLNSPNGKIPINYSSLNVIDLDIIRSGGKIIFRPGVHEPHTKTCNNYKNRRKD
jgi:hypothetical protein